MLRMAIAGMTAVTETIGVMKEEEEAIGTVDSELRKAGATVMITTVTRETEGDLQVWTGKSNEESPVWAAGHLTAETRGATVLLMEEALLQDLQAAEPPVEILREGLHPGGVERHPAGS